MKIDITSLCFGFKIEKDNDSGTAAWATSIGQAPKDICYIDTNREGLDEIVYGMMYKSHSDFENLKVRDVIGLDKREEPRGDRERMMFSVFEDVYVNNMKVDGIYTLTYEREDTPSHKNRLHICYAKYLTYNGHSNKDTLKEMAHKLGCSEDACWFVTDITIRNQKSLHFSAIVVNSEHSMTYQNSKERKNAWEALIPEPENPFKNHQIDEPFLQIYYGAPGTGKSFEIDKKIKENKLCAVRTTFHPDSDYSTFVGAYKPIVEETEVRVVPIVVNNGISLNQNEGSYVEKRITYKFVMQSFMKAYLSAWKKMAENPDYPKAQILVIEEINRGNCAQIFGDLFQLLDRTDNGFSTYPIEADADLRQAICEAFKDSQDYMLGVDINVEYAVKDYVSNFGSTLSEDIQEGRVLLLPPNLYIWATMNTSDQSLFPIDSAFKRRWEWKYMKIKNEGKEWKIDVKIKNANGEEKLVEWWDFIRKVNDIIASMTSSADKQLGYFFCKADKKTPEKASEPNSENDLISVDTFVSKVLFYLWNDVFKDYGFEDVSLFQYINKTEEGKETKKDLTFPDFYREDSNDVNPQMVTDFVQKVMNWKKKEEAQN